MQSRLHLLVTNPVTVPLDLQGGKLFSSYGIQPLLDVSKYPYIIVADEK